MKLRIVIWSIVACLVVLFIIIFSNWEKAQIKYHLFKMSLRAEVTYDPEFLVPRWDGGGGIGILLDQNPSLVDYIVERLKQTDDPWDKATLIYLADPYANRPDVFPILIDSLKSKHTIVRFTSLEAVYGASIGEKFNEEQQRILVQTLEELLSEVKREEDEKLFQIKLVKEFIKSGGDRQLVCNLMYEHYLQTRAADASTTNPLNK